MSITIVSRFPNLVSHKVLHNVESFVVSPDGISVIRKITSSGSLVSDWFAFGNIFVSVSYQKE